MKHPSRRALSYKQHALNMFNSHMKVKTKLHVLAPCRTSISCNNNPDERYIEPQKTKRLKTRKQRNHIRDQISNRSNQSHQHCERGSKDKEPCSECQGHSLNFSRKEKTVAKPFPTQKQSIITEGRLTSLRGLFSHEVRSVDIERIVKEEKHQKHLEKQGRQATEGHSSSISPSCLIPHSNPPAVISEGSEEVISAYENKDQNSMTLDKIGCLQKKGTIPMAVHSGDGKHSSAQTPKTTDNTARSGSPPDQKEIHEAVILSSSENESVPKNFPTSVKVSLSDHNVISKKGNTHNQKQKIKATTAVNVQHNFVNTERLDTPSRSEVLDSDAPQFDPSPTIVRFSSPTLDKERSALQNESQHREPVFSSKDESVSRLAARLCHSLGSFPIQRSYPLLTECRKVLLHHLQEKHGSQLQHNLHRLQSQLCVEGRHSSHNAEQVRPSSEQKYLYNPQMYFSDTRKHEEDQQREIVECQTDNGSQKHCLQEDFCENVEREIASTRQRKQTWGIDSPEDFVTKLQQPCQDMLSQWSITEQSQGSHSASQMFSIHHKAFIRPQSPTPWSICTDQTLHPFLQEPQMQVKLGSSENKRRHSSPLPLEQWRNDPDFNFLFQTENSKRARTSLGALTELSSVSPQPNIERLRERSLFSASSTVSSFFPPEGFYYEPYYRFPHPSNSFNR